MLAEREAPLKPDLAALWLVMLVLEAPTSLQLEPMRVRLSTRAVSRRRATGIPTFEPDDLVQEEGALAERTVLGPGVLAAVWMVPSVIVQSQSQVQDHECRTSSNSNIVFYY